MEKTEEEKTEDPWPLKFVSASVSDADCAIASVLAGFLLMVPALPKGPCSQVRSTLSTPLAMEDEESNERERDKLDESLKREKRDDKFVESLMTEGFAPIALMLRLFSVASFILRGLTLSDTNRRLLVQ